MGSGSLGQVTPAATISRDPPTGSVILPDMGSGTESETTSVKGDLNTPEVRPSWRFLQLKLMFDLMSRSRWSRQGRRWRSLRTWSRPPRCLTLSLRRMPSC